MYIDTSCLAAYYLPEPESKQVQRQIHLSDRVTISYITEIELLSAINKKVRVSDLRKADGIKSWKLFQEHRQIGLFDVAELSTDVFKSAELLMETTSYALRSLDAIHLGIVYHFSYKLYTFDQMMLDFAKEFDIEIV